MEAEKKTGKPKIIFMIPYAHCDNAWSHTRKWHENRYTQIFIDVLDIMKRDPDYKWYFDTTFEELSPFERRHPERMPELKKRIKEGRIEIAPTAISNPMIDSIGTETFIRNMVYGRRYFERVFGVTSDVYTANDLTPGNSQMPQILRKGGYKYYRFTRPSKNHLIDFYWQGLDGTQILSSRGDYGYGSLASGRAFPHDYKTNWENAAGVIYGEIDRRFASIFKDGRLVEKIEVSWSSLGNVGIVWFPRGGDDSRPLRALSGEPVDVLGLVREWQKREKVPMKFGTPSEYFAELEKHKGKMPVVSGVLSSSGASCRFGMLGKESFALWWTKNDYAITTAERMSTLADICAGKRYPEQAIDSLWNALFTTTGHALRLAFTNDYDRLLSKHMRIHQRAAKLSDSAINSIAENIAREGAPVEIGAVPIVVFNSLAWDRTDLATATMQFEKGKAAGLRLTDSGGQSIPYQITDLNRYADGTLKRVSFKFIVEVPSFGYATYYVSKQNDGSTTVASVAADRRENEGANAKVKIGNQYFDVVVEKGKLVSVSRKNGGVELFDAKKNQINAVSNNILEGADDFDTLGSFLEEIEETDNELVHVERGPVYSKIVTGAKVGKHGLIKEIIIYERLERIDLITEIDAKGGDWVFKAKFPLSFEGKLMSHIPFGTEKRELSKEPCRVTFASESHPHTFTADKWIDYANVDYGVAFFSSPGQRGFDFIPEDKLVKHIILKPRTIPKKTCWKHISKYHDRKGQNEIAYSIYPHSGDWKKAQVHRRAAEYHEPLMCRVFAGGSAAGSAATPLAMPARHGFLNIGPENIVMTAFYKQGDRTIMRVYESHGKKTIVVLMLPYSASKAVECDYYGNPLKGGKKIEALGKSLKFEAEPWEIVTLLISPA